jgi:hypothetical protein
MLSLAQSRVLLHWIDDFGQSDCLILDESEYRKGNSRRFNHCGTQTYVEQEGKDWSKVKEMMPQIRYPGNSFPSSGHSVL